MRDERDNNPTDQPLPAASDGENAPDENAADGDDADGTDTDAGPGPNGQFASGNGFGRGNPYARRVNEFRAVLFDAVSNEDLKEIAQTLLDQAKAGNLDASKILFDRLLGKPTQHSVNENFNHEDEDSASHYIRQQILQNAAAAEALCSFVDSLPPQTPEATVSVPAA